MSILAKGLAISDVALTKRCRAVDAPVPPRGYWARKAAGQDPPRAPLPKYRSRTVGNSEESPAVATAPPEPDAVVREGPEPAVNFRRPVASPEPDSTVPASPQESAIRAQLNVLAIAPTMDLLADHRGAMNRSEGVVSFSTEVVKKTGWHRRKSTVALKEGRGEALRVLRRRGRR